MEMFAAQKRLPKDANLQQTGFRGHFGSSHYLFERAYVSAPDLETTSIRPSTMEDEINEIYSQLPLFLQNVSRIENCVQSLSQAVSAFTTDITNVEQIVSSLGARVATETNAASASSVSGSANSWNLLGHSDGSTATGSHGSGSDGNRNTRRRLDTFSGPDDGNT